MTAAIALLCIPLGFLLRAFPDAALFIQFVGFVFPLTFTLGAQLMPKLSTILLDGDVSLLGPRDTRWNSTNGSVLHMAAQKPMQSQLDTDKKEDHSGRKLSSMAAPQTEQRKLFEKGKISHDLLAPPGMIVEPPKHGHATDDPA